MKLAYIILFILGIIAIFLTSILYYMIKIEVKARYYIALKKRIKELEKDTTL